MISIQSHIKWLNSSQKYLLAWLLIGFRTGSPCFNCRCWTTGRLSLPHLLYTNMCLLILTLNAEVREIRAAACKLKDFHSENKLGYLQRVLIFRNITITQPVRWINPSFNSARMYSPHGCSSSSVFLVISALRV